MSADGFAWQDFIAVVGVLCGTIQVTRLIPNFPINSFWARFANGLHVSVTVAIYGAFATPSVPFMQEVNWIDQFFHFPMPLFAYSVIILMGMSLFVSTTMQAVFTALSDNKNMLTVVSTTAIGIDLFVLYHMLSIL